MASLFDYSMISVNFQRETRSCNVEILNNQHFDAVQFSIEMEKFYDWLTNKTEIYSVLIKTQKSNFELLPKKLLKEFNEKNFLDYIKRLQRISFGQLILPQTIIWNMSGEFDQLAFELCSASDYQVGNWNFSVNFDSLTKGYTSFICSALYSNNVQSTMKFNSFTLVGKTVNVSELVSASLISNSGNDQTINSIQENISSMSPIARIQFKRSINDWIVKNIDEVIANTLSFQVATLAIGDWKNFAYDQEFHNPREIAKIIKNIPTRQEMKERQLA